jgi:diguanylate cyclase (GGDEF)-like protein
MDSAGEAALQQQRTTSFAILPTVALAVATVGLLIASMIIGAHEVDRISLDRQRATIEQAIDQHGLSLARELRVQSVWNEGYERVRAKDTTWLHKFYGAYLSQLLGYDRIYVLSGSDEPIYGFVAGDPNTKHSFREIAPGLEDLVRAARNPNAKVPEDNALNTDIDLGDGLVAHHRAVADVRLIEGTPATVVVSTIVPDHTPHTKIDANPDLLVAVEDLDKSYTKRLGSSFSFRNLHWINGKVPEGFDTESVKTFNDKPVGTLAWNANRPGMEFIRRAAPGLLLALLPIAALTYLLISWGQRQAKRLVESEHEATQAARTDVLTALPNRMALRELFGQLLAKAKQSHSPLTVLSIDIDHFKSINDAFGHAVGDAVLIAAARRLNGMAPSDGVVARPDGDGFVLLAPGLNSSAGRELASDVVAALAQPFDLDGGTRVFIAASVGYAIGPRDGDTGDELLRRAELAVDKAKEDGDPSAVGFTPELDAEVTYRLMLESALRTAVADGSIKVVYQPLMDPSGKHVLGVEALARWSEPDLGNISPEIFIPLAEETGLIQNIGELVLRRAVEDAKSWSGVTVAVNVSASQIHHGDIVQVVRDALEASHLAPERLEIEITESVLLTDEKRANEQMRNLQGLGARVVLDDFGTGYSSLQYLRRFGFDKLKIDRSFIDGAGDPGSDSVVLASIIRLGHDLALTITAEGVETDPQRRWLQAAGCHQLQGYLFSAPLSAADMAKFIAAHKPDTAAVAS